MQSFQGDGNWYYSGDGAYTWSEFEHHSQVQAPVGIPTPFPGVFEGGIDELGLGENQEDKYTHVHIIQDENIVYIMDEDFLHIVDMSTHIIASIDYYNGLYCSPWGESTTETDHSDVLLQCFDLFYFDEATNVHIRAIIEPEKFELRISQILNSNSDLDDRPKQPDVGYHVDPPVILTNVNGWTRWDDIDDPGLTYSVALH